MRVRLVGLLVLVGLPCFVGLFVLLTFQLRPCEKVLMSCGLFEYRSVSCVWGFCWMVRKKKLAEYEQRVEEAVAVLDAVSEDTTTPRNIRRAAKNSIEALRTAQYSLAVRASNAISLLDEILQDPNMPPYTRVKLWNVMSILEAIKD